LCLMARHKAVGKLHRWELCYPKGSLVELGLLAVVAAFGAPLGFGQQPLAVGAPLGFGQQPLAVVAAGLLDLAPLLVAGN
jgi:hypothetical protein